MISGNANNFNSFNSFIFFYNRFLIKRFAAKRIPQPKSGSHYNGYDKDYCFLPLYVFCGDQLLVSYLRPSNIDGAKHTWAILALLVEELRKHWPDVIIIFRADSGFCRDQIFTWCHKNQVFYIVAMGKNAVIRKKARKNEKKAAKKYSLIEPVVMIDGQINLEYSYHPWQTFFWSIFGA